MKTLLWSVVLALVIAGIAALAVSTAEAQQCATGT